MQKALFRIFQHPDYYCFSALLFSLSMNKRVTSAVFAIWAISWLVKKLFFSQNKKWFAFDSTVQKRLFFTVVLYYIAFLASLLWTSNLETGLHKLETKLSFILAPLILLNVEEVYVTKIKLLFRAFIYGLLTSSLICLFMGFANCVGVEVPAIYSSLYKSFSMEGLTFVISDNFYYDKFSFFMHPSYFSMMITFGVLIVRLKYFKLDLFKRDVSFLLIGFFLLMLFFLSSKAGILITYAIILLDILFQFIRNKRLVKTITQGITYLFLFYFTISFNPRKPVDTITKSTDFQAEVEDIETFNSVNQRVIIWKSAFSVFASNPIYGMGIGDSNNELLKKYRAQEFTIGIERKYNAHNQYLEDAINLGFIGLLLILLLLIIPIIPLFKRNSILAVYFILIVAMNFLFESMLEKQTGVVFISVFYALIIVKQKASAVAK